MDENAVIDGLCEYLAAEGYAIELRLHTTQQGVDVIARDSASGRRLFVEAKGATSSREGSARYGQGFTPSQVFDRVAKGLYTGFCMRAEHPDTEREDVALAFPDTPAFRKRLEPISKQLRDVSVGVFLVAADGAVAQL
jgi:hypothetical protein